MNQYSMRLMLDLVIYNMIAIVLSAVGFMISSNSLDYAHFMFFLKRVILFVSAGVLIGSPFKTKVNIGGAVFVFLGVSFIFLKLFFYYVGGGVGLSIVNGVRYTYYESGAVKFETNYKNTKREGTSKGYYENGHLKSEAIYKNDIILGSLKIFYQSGKLKSENFYNGTKIIKIKTYDETGNLMSERENSEGINAVSEHYKGLIDGALREFHPNGALKRLTIVKNKVLINLKEYDLEGNLINSQGNDQ